jgi:hypothetical protein
VQASVGLVNTAINNIVNGALVTRLRFDAAQTLSPIQKTQARDNLDLLSYLLRYDAVQTLTAPQIAQVYANLSIGNTANKNIGTTAGTVAAGDDARIVGASQKASNLSDLASIVTARVNLGLGSAALRPESFFQVAGNYQVNLGFTPLNKAGDTMTGGLTVINDIHTNRGNDTGVIYFGNANTHYLYFDGSNYILPSGALYVNGSSVWTTAHFNYTPAQAGSNISQFANNVGYITAGGPISQFSNNSGYITAGGPVSQFWNNVGYITAGGGVSQFSNDMNFVNGIRLAFAGDLAPTGVAEPFSGAVVVGVSNLFSSIRYRYLQIAINGSWFTASLA